jgi:hypothetical protein
MTAALVVAMPVALVVAMTVALVVAMPVALVVAMPVALVVASGAIGGTRDQGKVRIVMNVILGTMDGREGRPTEMVTKAHEADGTTLDETISVDQTAVVVPRVTGRIRTNVRRVR